VIEVVLLDSGILALAAQRLGVAEADACRAWIGDCLNAGARVLVPSIANYETRRELIRAGKTAGVARLDAFISAEPDRYLLLTDVDLRLAAELWAKARQQGLPTADPKALDIDVILAAQALSLNLGADRFIVATTNVRHLSRFVPADLWNNIRL
jgi:predicted nucleic acid-binding protein